MILPPQWKAQPAQPAKDDFILHEDNWRQVEFVALKDEGYLANLVQEVSQFEKSNRVDVGWKEVFVRKEHPTQDIKSVFSENDSILSAK